MNENTVRTDSLEALAKPCKFGRGSGDDARDSLSYGQRGRCPSQVLQVPL